MRSNTSLYIGVYIWIASLEILTKILKKNPKLVAIVQIVFRPQKYSFFLIYASL